MLTHHIGEFNGQPFVPMDYQRHVIRAFGWKHVSSGLRRFRKFFIAVPKGSGKSPLCSGLAVYLAFFDNEPGSEVFVVAADRQQARIVHDNAKIFVQRSEHLSDLVDVYTNSIKLKNSTESLQVLSSESATAHGYRPHGIIFDEFHAQPNRDLFDALYRGMGKRSQPVLVMVTTAGDDDESICAEEWQYAQNVIKNPSVDETYFPMIFEASDRDDWTDPQVWKRTNPGFGLTVKADYFENECRAAQLEPRKRNSFLQLHLNRWVNQATAWIPVEWWDACTEPINYSELPGLQVSGGLDMSQKIDLTAFCAVFRKPLPSHVYADELVVDVVSTDETGAVKKVSLDLNYEITILAHFWLPEETLKTREREDGVPYSQWAKDGLLTPTEGNIIDYSRVHRDIVKFGEKYPKIKGGRIGYDPAFATDIATKLRESGFVMDEIPGNYRMLSEPSQIFEALVKSRRVRHGGNRLLRWCVENVAIKQDDAGRIRPVRPKKSGKRVDGVLGSVYGINRLMVQEPAVGKFQLFFVG